MSLPKNTQSIVTQEAISKADNIERCRLMREIVRGAKFSPRSVYDTQVYDQRKTAKPE
jgi:hypothetical protein